MNFLEETIILNQVYNPISKINNYLEDDYMFYCRGETPMAAVACSGGVYRSELVSRHLNSKKIATPLNWNYLLNENMGLSFNNLILKIKDIEKKRINLLVLCENEVDEFNSDEVKRLTLKMMTKKIPILHLIGKNGIVGNMQD